MTDKIFYCYVLSDPVTHKPFYVGKGQGNRMYNHEKLTKSGKVSNNNKKLFNKIQQTIKTQGSIGYDKIFSSPDESLVLQAEIDIIQYYRFWNGTLSLCNLTNGGEGLGIGNEALSERRKKISDSTKRKIVSVETKKKISNALKQRIWTVEMRNRMSIAQRNSPKTLAHCKEMTEKNRKPRNIEKYTECHLNIEPTPMQLAFRDYNKKKQNIRPLKNIS